MMQHMLARIICLMNQYSYNYNDVFDDATYASKRQMDIFFLVEKSVSGKYFSLSLHPFTNRTCKFNIGLRLHHPLTMMMVESRKSCVPLPLLLNELLIPPTLQPPLTMMMVELLKSCVPSPLLLNELVTPPTPPLMMMMMIELLKSCVPLPLLLNELVTPPTLLVSDLVKVNQISKLLAIN